MRPRPGDLLIPILILILDLILDLSLSLIHNPNREAVPGRGPLLGLTRVIDRMVPPLLLPAVQVPG